MKSIAKDSTVLKMSMHHCFLASILKNIFNILDDQSPSGKLKDIYKIYQLLYEHLQKKSGLPIILKIFRTLLYDLWSNSFFGFRL